MHIHVIGSRADGRLADAGAETGSWLTLFRPAILLDRRRTALGSYTLSIMESDDDRTVENQLTSHSSANMVTYQGRYDDFEKMLHDISNFIVADFSIVAVEGFGGVSYELRNMTHKAKKIDDFLTEKLVARRTPASARRPGTSKNPDGLYIAPAYRNEAQTA